MNQYLYEAMYPFVSLGLRNVSWEQIKSRKDLSECEIFIELMKYSLDGTTLPKQSDLFKFEDGKRLIWYVQKWFGGIQYFATKFKIDTNYKLKYWNETTIFETFKHILNVYKKIPNTKTIVKLAKNDIKLRGFIGNLDNNGGFVFWKNKFTKHMKSSLI